MLGAQVKILYKPTLFFLALCLFWAPVYAQNKIRSGIYEGVWVAVDDRGNLSGYYHDSMGIEATRSCQFFFAGKVSGEQGHITTWSNSMTLAGEIGFSPHGIKLAVENARDYPGCGSVLMPEISTGMDFDQTYSKKWLKLGRIKNDRVDIYGSCSMLNKRSGYLVAGDVFGVIDERKYCLRIEFLNKNGKSFFGWIPSASAELISDHPLLPGSHSNQD